MGAGVKISQLPPSASLDLADLFPHVHDGVTQRGDIEQILNLISSAIILPGTLAPTARQTAPTGWLLCYGQAISRATFDDLFDAIVPSVGTFTITIASPGVATLTGHGQITGDQVYLTTTGALPTGLTANTLYYIIRVDADTFRLATSRANAVAGTAINTTGTQSGTHTLRFCPYGLGDGSTTFNVPDSRGRILAGADAMGGTAATRLTLARSEGSYGNLGAAGGSESHALVTAELAAHDHSFSTNPGSWLAYASTRLVGTNQGAGGGAFSATTGSSGSGTAHNNVQPTLIANLVIKT